MHTDLLRIKANSKLDPKGKSKLGQYFTPSPISLYMASLFNEIKGDIILMDPGCGPGSLTAAFTDEAIYRRLAKAIEIDCYDIEPVIEPFINETLRNCEVEISKYGIECKTTFNREDFILNNSNSLFDLGIQKKYTHVIMNPPYKKIGTKSEHRIAMSKLGIETVNLYSGFVALAIRLLKPNGELVAIIPRSFCNGPYYKPFREYILNETSIEKIHLFDSRTALFDEDSVLQENIIIHLIKGKKQGDVIITSSPQADFIIDEETNSITATDKTTRIVSIGSIIKPNDSQKFIHISANNRDQIVIDRLSYFTDTLISLDLEVSTGPVVDFRLKEDLRENIDKGSVPLIYPQHLIEGVVQWPKKGKKPNAISVSNNSKSWLWKNGGYNVIVKRFSSKEEKRRIVATIYEGNLEGELIGFENKLNVFHNHKNGFDRNTAYGLFVFLNSSLLDMYYRLFGGHTQINATDLRSINYPSSDSLIRMGKRINGLNISQQEIDNIMEDEIVELSGDNENPMRAQEKIDEALEILIAVGMPRAQQNERSALTLLALLNLEPQKSWSEIENPMKGVTPIMDWCRDIYGKEYAPNTRETFRRQTLHQFLDGGLCLYNPDLPDRPVNSPHACYQIADELLRILVDFKTKKWSESLNSWLENKETLVAQYAKNREMEMIPLKLNDGLKVELSPGKHSELIRDIIVEFGSRFAPGAKVIYIGDTGSKNDLFKEEELAKLNVKLDGKGKLPDVILYFEEKNWLLLIESVTSHGPVDGKRHGELSELFKGCTAGLVYVTAFPNRRLMAKYLSEISWETEVWNADAPAHLIHFNGDKFLGPY